MLHDGEHHPKQGQVQVVFVRGMSNLSNNVVPNLHLQVVR